MRSKMDMPFLKLLSYFLLLTSFNLASSEVDIPTYIDHNCTINKNFSSDSPYQFNLNNLLLSLYSKVAADTNSTPVFYNTTVGLNDAVYGEYMCRGDVPMEVCQDCVQDATNRVVSECPNNKEAIIWYDQCFLRYSDSSFFSTLHQLPTVRDRRPFQFGPNTPLTACTGDASRSCTTGPESTGMVEYIELNETLNDAVVEAATSTKKFATKEANLTSGVSLYTLVQCTPDLDQTYSTHTYMGTILFPSTDS